jgi:hypothetical protein
MSTAATKPGPAATLIASLLPDGWPDRAAMLEAGDHLDREHGDAALDALLGAWTCWRATAALPAGALGDVVRGLVVALGSVGTELRARPRGAKRPVPAIGLRPRRRLDGTAFLAGVLDEDLVLAAGTELHLVRIRSDNAGTGPTHCLRVFPPSVAPTAAALRRAAADRLDASAIRDDHRNQEPLP